MPADRNARRAIQRELGDLGQVQDYQSRRELGRRMTGWYAAVTGDAVDGCDCITCRALATGKKFIWLGPDRVDACFQARNATIRHERSIHPEAEVVAA